MVNLTACRTAQDALDTVAKQFGFMDIPATLIFYDNKITGIDMKFGEAILKWRKPKND
jgi:hypothetical protein